METVVVGVRVQVVALVVDGGTIRWIEGCVVIIGERHILANFSTKTDS